MNGVLDLRPILPAAIVSVTALVVLLAQAFTPKGGRAPLVTLSIAGLLAALASVALLASGPGRGAVLAGALSADDFSLFLHALVLGVALVAVTFSPSYLRENGMERGEYYALLLFSVVGMLGLVSSLELVSIFVALEIMSIALYGLVGLRRSREESQESALKYFIVGSFSSAFFLYGIALLYGVTGSTSLDRVARGLAAVTPAQSSLAILGTAMLLVGFAFKVASVPFHMWAPDVYEGAPTPVTGFMAAGVKVAAFGALLRVFGYALPSLALHWQPLVAVLAAVTMVVGNLAALAQRNLKRMLAYSSVAHAGYLLTAMVAAPGLAGEAMLFYLVGYAAVNLGAFGALAALSRDGREPFGWQRPRRALRAAARARRRADGLPRLAHRHPGDRRLRRQVLPVQRGRRRGLGVAGDRRRPDERRLGVLLPARGGGDVHERARGRGPLGEGVPGLRVRARRHRRGRAAPRRLAGAGPRRGTARGEEPAVAPPALARLARERAERGVIDARSTLPLVRPEPRQWASLTPAARTWMLCGHGRRT